MAIIVFCHPSRGWYSDISLQRHPRAYFWAECKLWIGYQLYVLYDRAITVSHAQNMGFFLPFGVVQTMAVVTFCCFCYCFWCCKLSGGKRIAVYGRQKVRLTKSLAKMLGFLTFSLYFLHFLARRMRHRLHFRRVCQGGCATLKKASTANVDCNLSNWNCKCLATGTMPYGTYILTYTPDSANPILTQVETYSIRSLIGWSG